MVWESKPAPNAFPGFVAAWDRLNNPIYDGTTGESSYDNVRHLWREPYAWQ